MRFVMFYHSLLSDWNHGNAHFLRGVAGELLSRGHEVAVYEPRDSWSLRNLIASHGYQPLRQLVTVYPWARSIRYDSELDIEKALDGADAVIVHEWNDAGLVRRIGRQRRAGGFKLFFHDTHHRTVTEAGEFASYGLRDFDGVLAFGEALRDLYIRRGLAERAWTWHEAADTQVFFPIGSEHEGDLVWIGNWGDEERSFELFEFLLGPSKDLGLKARVHGVRYPEQAIRALDAHGIEYGGWLPNFSVPRVYSRFKFTVHVPRRPYVRALPGIPTIRVFEALACGMPLVSTQWDDSEGLFIEGSDFLMARNVAQMRRLMKDLACDEGLRSALSTHGRKTVLERHTCAHRVDDLIGIIDELRAGGRKEVSAL